MYDSRPEGKQDHSWRVPMTDNAARDITQLLQAWRNGDPEALERLTPMVYNELHRAARISMRREAEDHTLQTTALISELYLRIAELKRVDWQSRSHFFAVCARQMRRILTDSARSRHTDKRGGAVCVISLEEAPEIAAMASPNLLLLDEALNELANFDQRKSRVVELRFFGGLNVEETAEVLGVSPDTIARDWRLAKAWLLHEMSSKVDES